MTGTWPRSPRAGRHHRSGHHDATVTAANESLIGSGGVDGAGHGVAGPRPAEAGAALGPCEPGDAMAAPAFDLRTAGRRVIHTVGPGPGGR
ncbi:macro domain-containing protein [Streptomyces sp. NPDC005722]